MQVSVIIPVYNAAAFVTQAVESALAQPETGQVILIEDGSKDDSLSVCQVLAREHSRIDLLRHIDGRNHGVAASRNLGIGAAQCEYIAFLDADDYYLPGRFRAAREILSADSRVDGVYDAIGTLYQDEQCSRWYCQERHPDLITVRKAADPSELFGVLLADDGGYFCTDGIVVRACVFERTGVFDTSLRICEDTALWLKMAAVGRLMAGSRTEPVGMRRLHGNNITYQTRQCAGYYAIKMAESLLVWGREVGLPRERMLLLTNALLNFHLGEIPANAAYAWRKLRALWLFSRFVLQHPLAIKSQHYRRIVGSTVGWTRTKGLFGHWVQALSLR